MSKKKIGFKVSQSLGVNAHGAETHTVVEFMKYFLDEYDVDIIGCEVYPKELEKYNIYTYIKYMKFPKILRKVLHIPLSILNTLIYTYKNKPDLLFIPGGVFYNGLAILIAGKIFGVKILVRTAEDHFNYYKFCENWNCRLKHYFITNLVSKFVLKSSDYVLTVGENSREYFIEKGVKRDRIFGIPGPISQENFLINIPKKDLRKELGLPLEKTIVLYAGAISGVKGADELPKVMDNILIKSKDFFFCVVGSETNGIKISTKIKETGKDNCAVISPQPHSILKKYFKASDILVFLTKVGVGYGQITIEATKSGLPVISYDSGLDVKWFMKENCFQDIDKIADYILQKDYSILNIPEEFNEKYIKTEHLKMLRNIMNK